MSGDKKLYIRKDAFRKYIARTRPLNNLSLKEWKQVHPTLLCVVRSHCNYRGPRGVKCSHDDAKSVVAAACDGRRG